MTGSWLTVIAQSLLVYEITSSGFAIGLIGACQFLPVIFFSSWAGLLADRCDKRRALMILQAAALVQALALALVATMERPPLVGLCIFAALRGSTATFDLPIRRAMVSETVPPHLAGNAIALNGATMASSLVCGSALGGLLVTNLGYALTFFADAATYTVAIITLWRIRPGDLLASLPMPRRPGQLRDALAAIQATTTLRVGLTLTVLTGLAYNFPVVLLILVSDGFGRPTATFTYVYSALSLGSVSGALLIARQRDISLQLLSRLALLFGIATIALGLNPVFILAFPIAAAVGMTGYGLLAGSVTVIQTASDPSMRGRVMGFHSIASIGTWAISAPFIGWICQTAGPRVGIAMTGVSCVCAAAWARSQLTNEAATARHL